MPEAIANRTLKLDTQSGTVDVPVRLFSPEKTEGAWRCRFEIEWPDGRDVRAASGRDAVQALVAALQMIGVSLYTSEAHAEGLLWFEEPGDGYGFPIVPSMRDMLVGHDALSF